MGLVYLYTIKININVGKYTQSSHGMRHGVNGFCIRRPWLRWCLSLAEQVNSGSKASNLLLPWSRWPLSPIWSPTTSLVGRFSSVFCRWLFWCWFFVGSDAGRMHKFGKVEGCELKHKRKKGPMEAQKNGLWCLGNIHNSTPFLPSTKFAGKKTQRFLELQQPPKVLVRFGKISFVFFPANFCSMGFLF